MKDKMKRILPIAIIVAICFSLAYQIGLRVGASNSEPGSAGDPLITQSYLEKRLDEEQGSFQKITLNKGKTIKVSLGTQLMLYKGSATVFGSNGIVDITTGKLSENSSTVIKYHMYLVTTGDYGFKATTDSTVYVSGSYQIK